MIKRCQIHLGTFVEISVFQNLEKSHEVIEQAFALIKEIESSLSFFDQKSDLFLINNKAFSQEIEVSQHLIKVMKFAQNLFQTSNGLFDVTRHRSLPEFSMKDIIVRNSSIKFLKPVTVDLAGIAKGYVVDCVCDFLENNSVNDFIVNAGGDLRVGNFEHEVAIRNPANPQNFFHKVKISNLALATSSGYFDDRFLSNDVASSQKKYPIFAKDLSKDQNKSFANYEAKSASVFSPNCMTSDALTKVVLMLEDDAKEVLKHYAAQALICSLDNPEVVKIIQ